MFIRRLPRFEYHAPATIAEALKLMTRYGSKASVLAGGTDLLVAMKNREKCRTPHQHQGDRQAEGIHLTNKRG